MEKLYKDKKVLIMGLGLHGGGVGVAKFFFKHGARILVTDLKTESQLKESIDKLKKYSVQYALGSHKEGDFRTADLIIKNPDVPNESRFLKIAKENNIPIETDVSLFFKLCNAFLIGVTGTKGKTTVASLIYRFLKTKYPNTFLAGNIGVSPLEIVDKIKKGDKVVLELSSFELENIDKSPNIAVVTNIMPDHLNRYDGMAEYIDAKKNIFRYQKEKDILILNYDNETVRDFSQIASSTLYFYSKNTKPRNAAAFLKEGHVYFSDRKKPTMAIKDFKLLGEHNISNLLAAVSAAKLLDVSCDNIRKSVRLFKGVSSRQELIREYKGVKYYNDTTATMPEAALEAIKSFRSAFKESKLILIAGGQDKGLDFSNLAEEIENSVDFLILLPGTASDKIKKELKNIKISLVSSMDEAVKKAREIASKGDVVFLSPAAASFNLFKNEFDRGDQFIKSVKSLK